MSDMNTPTQPAHEEPQSFERADQALQPFPGDLVSEALGAIRAAGARNVGESSVAKRRRERWASGVKNRTTTTQNKVWRRPTRLDGRADTRYRDPARAGDLLTNLVREQRWSKKISVGQIMNAWPELVGEQVAQHTTPTRYDDKTMQLTVQCDSTSWATNLRLMQTRVLQSIARKVGPDVVAEVKILGPNNRMRSYGKLRVKGRGPRDDFG
ncbi:MULTISPECIES: DUF721 domain-containing protein [Corynebacterium]|nr:MULTISPECIES: DciA family protein [Corynebacterium]